MSMKFYKHQNSKQSFRICCSKSTTLLDHLQEQGLFLFFGATPKPHHESTEKYPAAPAEQVDQQLKAQEMSVDQQAPAESRW